MPEFCASEVITLDFVNINNTIGKKSNLHEIEWFIRKGMVPREYVGTAYNTKYDYIDALFRVKNGGSASIESASIDVTVTADVFKDNINKETSTNFVQLSAETGAFIFRIHKDDFTAYLSGRIRGRVDLKLKYHSVIQMSDFKKQSEMTNVALNISGGIIYANKQILAINSSVFRALFFGDFVEKNKTEIEIKDVRYREFVLFLNYVYNYPTDLDVNDLSHLITLADRFDSPCVRHKCDEFLLTSEKPLHEKMELAVRYSLKKTENFCLDTFKTMEDFTKGGEIANTMNETAKDGFMKKFFGLMNGGKAADLGDGEKCGDFGVQEDFSSESQFADTILVVSGTKFHVNKYMIAINSPVFKSMLIGKEEEYKEFVIDDVKPEEFVVFLRFVYNYELKANEHNVELLLNLADHFQVLFVKRICENYLLLADMDWVEKLEIADKFLLHRLRYQSIDEIDSKEDFKELETQFFNFNELTKSDLIQKLSEVV